MSTTTFGAHLKREREARNVSLDDVAKSTKISKRHLRELEEERFKDLPGGIFNKGFVRAYARHLGLNEEEMVAEYVAAEANTNVQPMTPPIAMETQKLMSSMAIAKEREESVRASDPAARVLTAAVAIAVVLGVGGYAYKYFEERNSGTARAAEQSPAPQAHTVPQKTRTVAADTAPATAPAAPEMAAKTAEAAAVGVRVELHARETSWMQVSADGRAPVEMTLNANQSRKFYAEKQLVMKFGNAEAIEVVKNGKALPPFAPGTKTQTVTYKPEM